MLIDFIAMKPPQEHYIAKDSLKSIYKENYTQKEIKLANSVRVPLSLRPMTVDYPQSNLRKESFSEPKPCISCN